MSQLKRYAGLNSMNRGCLTHLSPNLLTKQNAQNDSTFCRGSEFRSFSLRLSLIDCSYSRAILWARVRTMDWVEFWYCCFTIYSTL